MLGDERIRPYSLATEPLVEPIVVMNSLHYEPEESSVIAIHAEHNSNIVDVWANIELYSIRFGKRFQNAGVFAFELMP